MIQSLHADALFPNSTIESGVLSSHLLSLSISAMDYLSVIQSSPDASEKPLILHAASGGSLSLDDVGYAIFRSFQQKSSCPEGVQNQVRNDAFWDQLISASASDFDQIAQWNESNSKCNARDSEFSKDAVFLREA